MFFIHASLSHFQLKREKEQNCFAIISRENVIVGITKQFYTTFQYSCDLYSSGSKEMAEAPSFWSRLKKPFDVFLDTNFRLEMNHGNMTRSSGHFLTGMEAERLTVNLVLLVSFLTLLLLIALSFLCCMARTIVNEKKAHRAKKYAAMRRLAMSNLCNSSRNLMIDNSADEVIGMFQWKVDPDSF